ncbi:MAG: extracellular solute-binding protein, partial [Oscillospiraceae bacterium]|nr:extracellular solute-binding protein [Oscillospiraceae bacterium]
MLIFVLNIKSFVKPYSEGFIQNKPQEEVVYETEKTKIVFADNFVGAKNIISQFEQKYSGIEVQFIELPLSKHEAYNFVASALRSGDTTPDIIGADVTWMSTLSKNGYLCDITKTYEKIENDVISKFHDCVFYNDKCYGIPLSADSLVLVYRSDLCEIPPKTWQGLISISKAFKERYGTSPFVWSGKNDKDLTALVVSLLLSMSGQTESPDYSPEQIKMVIDFLKQTIGERISPTEVLHMSEVDVAENFANDKSAFAIISTEYLPLIEQNEKMRGKYSIAKIPTYTSDDISTKSLLFGKNLVLNQNSKHKKEALLFIEFYTSLKNQQQMLETNKQLPTLSELYQSPNITQKQPIIEQMSLILNNTEDVGIVQDYMNKSDDISSNIYNLLSREHIDKDELLSQISQSLTQDDND